ncbi:hypothetical protein MPOCJGCO_2774 [Methylobacterium trifolii]|uniref:Uncharacterized protein n=1 Tax=Methylobacterium trifolii TaxID=1003092 RepID=A0ABQ4U3J1_9HYPH|nr:hypothetical protein MPOCJGCO_2774 [Methylobacterium trifolii]
MRFHHGGVVEEAGHARAVERRRHHQDAQVLPQRPLRIEGEGEAEVGVEGALVELVEQHGADAAEFRVVEDHAGEHPLGDDLDPGAPGDPGAQPHAQAHGLADPLAQGRGHALGGGPRRQAPRLQQDDLAPGQPGFTEEGEGYAGGLARARRRDEHGRVASGQGRAQVRQRRFDRQGRGVWRLGHRRR